MQIYITIIANQEKTLGILNSGPEDAWITYDGTRLTFDDIASSNTFAAVILEANSTAVTATQDSLAFPVNSTLSLKFSTAKNPPATTGSTGLITPGDYNMKMHINGYDVNNSKLSRTLSFGTVKVI